MRWLLPIFFLLVFSCNKEDCTLLADQAILAFESYEIDANDSTCLAAKDALEFYINNCEAEDHNLVDALESLPCQ